MNVQGHGFLAVASFLFRLTPWCKSQGSFLEATRMGIASGTTGDATVSSRVEMEPDKQSDGEKARAKEWLLASRKDGNLHA